MSTAGDTVKLFTATGKTQGQWPDDFHFCHEGELVIPPPIPCFNHAGECGCERAWAGLNTHRGTTTAMVREVDIGIEDYIEAVSASLQQQGWAVSPGGVRRYAELLADLASDHPVGSVFSMGSMGSMAR
ncbi:MAG: hypothetical protein LC808_41705 [Actinobacteria bacterium]|nr:hypothetical protein [Actinomycetota bacterium]